MAAPTLLSTYPADGDSGIPTGTPIVLQFDRGVDLLSIKDYIVLYGPDFDQTSGADSVLFVDQDTGDNPFFLRSPGFKGLVDIRIIAEYLDLDTQTVVNQVITSEVDETSYGAAGIGHKISILPVTGLFAPDTTYVLHILGDPDSQGTGVSSRTVFDVVPNGGNLSDTGKVYIDGSYTGPDVDTLNIQITTAGDIGIAKYKYWFTSEGEPSSVYDKLTNRRNRSLSKGLQVRFGGEGFALGDTFEINVEPAQRLATNTQVTFTTNDGSYTAAPSSPSTPATSEPPSTVLPPAPGEETTSSRLQIEEMIPADGAFNVSTNTRQIIVIFSEPLDSSTVSGQGENEPVELQKKVTVSSNILTIDF
jgi:hypothetical protein